MFRMSLAVFVGDGVEDVFGCLFCDSTEIKAKSSFVIFLPGNCGVPAISVSVSDVDVGGEFVLEVVFGGFLELP